MLLATSTAGIAQDRPTPAHIGKTFAESTPASTPSRLPRSDAPNILVWMIDDLGFGQLGCYGGLVATPNLDKLAKTGLRYTNYHTTPICSASRAAFLTGRNPHTVHVGGHTASPTNFPGYDGHIPHSAGTIAENLRQAGYTTLALGKWDHLPSEDASQSGPFTYWPSGQGFDQFYGFLSAEANNFHPVLWNGHVPAPVPAGPDYHLTTDLAEHAIRWIDARDSQSPRRPFFMYFATGATHAPHHAPESYLARYRGKFDMGWDKAREEILRRQKALGIVPADTVLPPRPSGMPAWDSLSRDQQRMYAREMEAFAAQLTHADAEFGLILAELKRRGELENTIVMVMSDNGASAEGGFDGSYNEELFMNGRKTPLADNLQRIDQWGSEETYPHYALGWAVAGNTPFRYYKQTAYEGGVRVPLIISWKRAITESALRNQFVDVIDLLPTILDAADIAPAKIVNGESQSSFDGKSLATTLTNADAQSPRKVQYFEMFGNRAIWADGWKAVMPHRLKVWDIITQPPITDEGWQLYYLRDDTNELHDLAAAKPAKLDEMIALFDREAVRYNVYPLTNTGEAFQVRLAAFRKQLADRKGLWAYHAPIAQVPEALAPPMQMLSYRITARIDTQSGDEGVITAMGSSHGGVSLYLVDGRPVFTFANIDGKTARLAAPMKLPAGENEIVVDFTRREGGADIRLGANGKIVATGSIEAELPVVSFSLNDGFDVGQDSGDAVSSDYAAPSKFQGVLREITFQFPTDLH